MATFSTMYLPRSMRDFPAESTPPLPACFSCAAAGSNPTVNARRVINENRVSSTISLSLRRHIKRVHRKRSTADIVAPPCAEWHIAVEASKFYQEDLLDGESQAP
jgi:hypothetical protein